MGPANQPVSKSTQEQITPQHIPSKHPKFINAQLSKFKDERTYLQVNTSIGNIMIYNSWQKTFKQIQKNIAPNSLYLPFECQYQQQGLCGTAGILKLKFEYFPFLLHEEIANRQYNSLPFEQKQLWFLLYILVQTAAAAHSKGCLIGDIQPKNIFINDSGDIAIYNILSFPEEFNNFQKVRYFKQQNYLPPEGVNDIQTGKQTPTYDQKKGQSFSIALCILDAIFLTDHSFLYDKMEGFNQIAFMRIMETVQNLQMNSKLKNCLVQMLSMNPQKRLSCVQLYEYLAPYEKQIFELQHFEIIDELKLRFHQQESNSIGASARDSGQKVAKRSRRRNLVRYSLESSQRNNKAQQSVQGKAWLQGQNSSPSEPDRKQNQCASNSRSIQFLHKQMPQELTANYSNKASESSTVNKLQSREEITGKNANALTNKFEDMQTYSSSFNKKLNYVNQVNSNSKGQIINASQLNRQLYHIEEPEYTDKPPNSNPVLQNPSLYFRIEGERKQPSMIFKTGNLFRRERSSPSVLDYTNNEQINNQGYQNTNHNKDNNLGHQNTNNQLTNNLGYQNTDNQQINNPNHQNANQKSPKPTSNPYFSNSYRTTEQRTSLEFAPTSNEPSEPYTDFLQQIDKQIQESKKLFPDSFK